MNTTEFEKLVGMTLEEWRVKTDKEIKSGKIIHQKQVIEDIEFMDDSSTKTRRLKLANTKLSKFEAEN